MQDRVILHADLSNFYASCECSRDMSIKDKVTKKFHKFKAES